MANSGRLTVFVCAFYPLPGPVLEGEHARQYWRKAYKGVFSLFLLISYALIIVGWRGAVAQPIYFPSF